LLVLSLLVGLAGGCVELGIYLSGMIPTDSPNGSGSGGVDGDGGPSEGNGGDGVPVVRLEVSNPFPQSNEEVFLTCVLTDGDPEDVTFAFQPASGRLIVDSRTGRASFVVDASDVGIEYAVTCTATNAFGTSQASNEQVIIATQ
jgi:hypothetical protein